MHEDQLAHGVRWVITGQSSEANDQGIVLLTGMERFCGVGSLVAPLFQKGSLVCSLADMDDLVGRDGPVCVVEHDAMTLDQPELTSRKERGLLKMKSAHSSSWCSCQTVRQEEFSERDCNCNLDPTVDFDILPETDMDTTAL